MRRWRSARTLAVACIAATCILPLPAEQWDKDWYWKDVPYVPTPQVIVDAMLDLAGVRSEDVVYDLGSGDGRIVITAAASYGARGVGIEHHPRLVEWSRQQAVEAGVDDLARFSKIPGWSPIRKIKAGGRPVYLYTILE